MFQPNRAFWWLNLATGTSHKIESWANCLVGLEVLSCSAPTVVTLQLPYMLHTCATFGNFLVAIQSRDSSWVHTSWVFFTLSHTLPLHKFHLNTRYLITKLQANLARNKANTWLNKFKLSISPKTESRLNMWVGKCCQNSLTSNSRNCETLESYEQVFPEKNTTRQSL